MSDEYMTDEEYRRIAQLRASCSEDIKVDEDALVSRAHDHPSDIDYTCRQANEDGAYVQAWLWIPLND